MTSTTINICHLLLVFLTSIPINTLTTTPSLETVCSVFNSEYTGLWSQETNKEVSIVSEKVRRRIKTMAPSASFVFDRGKKRSRLVHKTPSASFVFDRG